MKKGFTLIELLAVIVILAIIAVIAVPIILGIINDAKKETSMRSAELYLKAAELAIARENLDGEVDITNCTTNGDGNLVCGGKTIKVDMDGEKPQSGATITFLNGKITSVTGLTIAGSTYKINSNGSLVIDDNSSLDSETEGLTGTIYRNSTETVITGESITPHTKTVYCGIIDDETSCDYGISWYTNADCVLGMADLRINEATCVEGTKIIGLTNYETEETKNNITQNYYLKYEVEDDIIQASYACIKYNNIEACLQGGDSSYFGSFDEMEPEMSAILEPTNPTGNVSVIDSTRSHFLSNGGSCGFHDTDAYCGNSSLELAALSNGQVHASDDSIDCKVNPDGSSFCMLR